MRVHSLAMGVRFAAGGGREGWVRTILTAIGVGLGVMLLLGAASAPHALDAREQRLIARTVPPGGQSIKRTDSTLLYGMDNTTFHDQKITGTLLRPEGPRAPAPPGVRELPRNGEMVVSPALAELLSSPEGKLLRERLHFTTVGTITEPGLVGPGELAYYAVSDALTTEHGGWRIDHFGLKPQIGHMDPVLLVLIIVACVVLLMPVAIFIATAVRFGGERRDRRLAALRLVGADTRMVRWMAAGEALFGAVCGLLVGTAMFLTARQAAGSITVWNVNAFPSDLTPTPALAALVALAVPLCAVGVTLFALRAVTIEPLGVMRNSPGRRRRLWWRLPVPLVGIALLLANGPVGGHDGKVNPYLIAGGAVLMLFGITLLLPWVFEAAVGRFSGGPVPWQLAIRRLQLGSGAAARAVSGITVAVAGAIALQLYFSAIQQDFTKVTGQDPNRAQLSVTMPSHDVATARKMIDQLRHTEGVRGVIADIEASASRPGPLRKGEGYPPTTELTVGDCSSLSELAHTGSCKDGDVFVVKDSNGLIDSDDLFKIARPGAQVQLNDPDLTGEHQRSPRLWTIPKSARIIDSRKDPSGESASGIFATPGALDTATLEHPQAHAMVKIDPRVGDAVEYVRNTAARLDPLMGVSTLQNSQLDQQFSSVRTGLLVAATATLVLIAASMLVTTLEQLRERRRLLSVLVAFGTRRATLGWSLLWQTAVPVALGLALALACGAGLGVALLMMAGKSAFDWSVVWPMPAASAVLVLLVTLFSLPPLWRMMRPDGLRTE